jgi:hypothetical protein
MILALSNKTIRRLQIIKLQINLPILEFFNIKIEGGAG